jgi:hypothetical protein
LLLGLVPFLAITIDNSYAAPGPQQTPTCNAEDLARLEADFQQMVEIRAKQPNAFSDAEFKAAALAYIAAAEICFQATVQAKGQTDTEPVIIDEGARWPYPELEPLFNTRGLKWGANSPFAGGQNVPGPGTAGGIVTYSYMPAGVSHVGAPFDDGGTNLNVLTSLGVNGCIQNEIAAAFAAWSTVANIQFVQVADSGVASNLPGATGNIRIGAHAMDGSSGILAHAYFPPFSGDTSFSIAGDLHFDVGETWSCSPGPGVFDIGIVTLHEIGHSIGLNHEPINSAVMNPTYNAGLIGLLQDDINGAVSIYGTGTPLPPAACILIFNDDHEDGSAGWTVSNGAGSNNWLFKTDGQGYNGSANYWFVEDIGSTSDSYLISPVINATLPNLNLNFFHSYNLEAGYDGGVVEISVNGGPFTDVGSANFIKNGYNATISPDDSSPIAGRSAFSGVSGVYVESVVSLGSLVDQGDSFRIRFREANDPSVTTPDGWRVDDVKVCDVLRNYLPVIIK